MDGAGIRDAIPFCFPLRWGEETEGWAVRQISRQLWRVLPAFDSQDLYQEAYVSYLICCRRYGRKVRNARHLMALYKRTFLNRVHRMAKIASRLRLGERERFAIVYNHKSGRTLADLLMELQEFPTEIKNALLHILNGDIKKRKGEYPAHFYNRAAELDGGASWLLPLVVEYLT